MQTKYKLPPHWPQRANQLRKLEGILRRHQKSLDQLREMLEENQIQPGPSLLASAHQLREKLRLLPKNGSTSPTYAEYHK